MLSSPITNEPSTRVSTRHAHMVRMSTLGIPVLMCLLMACATPRHQGMLPPYPTDEELANDGSAASIKALEDRYLVQGDKDETTVGSAIRPRFIRSLMNEIHPDVFTYLASDPMAAAMVPARTWHLLHAVGSLMVWCSIPFFFAGFVPGLIVLVAAIVVQEVAEYGINNGHDRAVAIFNANLQRRIRNAGRQRTVPPGHPLQPNASDSQEGP